MKAPIDIKWATDPAKQDYPAARSFLNLIYDSENAKKSIKKLRVAAKVEFKAKDIFRASGLPLLDKNNYHVKNDRKKILEGDELSPILLVRDTKNGKVIIADGYHRMCAVYTFDEDAVIRCRIV